MNYKRLSSITSTEQPALTSRHTRAHLFEFLGQLLKALESESPLEGPSEVPSHLRTHVYYGTDINALSFSGTFLDSIRIRTNGEGINITLKTQEGTEKSYECSSEFENGIFLKIVLSGFLFLNGDEYEVTYKGLDPNDTPRLGSKTFTERGQEYLLEAYKFVLSLQPNVAQEMRLERYIQQFSLSTWHLFENLPQAQVSAKAFLSKQAETNPDIELLMQSEETVANWTNPEGFFRRAFLPIIVKDLKGFDWGKIMAKESTAQARNYPQIHHKLAAKVFEALKSVLEDKNEVSIYSLACGSGGDTWLLCEMIASDLRERPDFYQGKKIKILMTDGDEDLLTKAKKLRAAFKAKNQDVFEKKEKGGKFLVIQIAECFDHTKRKLKLEENKPFNIVSASGFFNRQVLTREEADAILTWITDPNAPVLTPGGGLYLTGLTPSLFTKEDLTAHHLTVDQTTERDLNLLSEEGVPFERAPFYVASYPLEEVL